MDHKPAMRVIWVVVNMGGYRGSKGNNGKANGNYYRVQGLGFRVVVKIMVPFWVP